VDFGAAVPLEMHEMIRLGSKRESGDARPHRDARYVLSRGPLRRGINHLVPAPE
jgi:hypothetical protein